MRAPERWEGEEATERKWVLSCAVGSLVPLKEPLGVRRSWGSAGKDSRKGTICQTNWTHDLSLIKA